MTAKKSKERKEALPGFGVAKGLAGQEQKRLLAQQEIWTKHLL